jgi:hypothetical protein
MLILNSFMKRYFLSFAAVMFFFGVQEGCTPFTPKPFGLEGTPSDGYTNNGIGSQDGVLVLCKDSEEFKRGFEKTIEGLEKRKECYEKGTPVYDNLEGEIGRTKERFEVYKNCICGDSDGLPHLIADGGTILYGINGTGDLIIPGFIFLYISGYIGWAGRRYLRLSRRGGLAKSTVPVDRSYLRDLISKQTQERTQQRTEAKTQEKAGEPFPPSAAGTTLKDDNLIMGKVTDNASAVGVEIDQEGQVRQAPINYLKRSTSDEKLATQIAGDFMQAWKLEEWDEGYDPIVLPEVKGLASLETNEVIIDVAAATYIMLTCFLWPLDAAREYFNGSLVLSGENIFISRR